MMKKTVEVRLKWHGNDRTERGKWIWCVVVDGDVVSTHAKEAAARRAAAVENGAR